VQLLWLLQVLPKMLDTFLLALYASMVPVVYLQYGWLSDWINVYHNGAVACFIWVSTQQQQCIKRHHVCTMFSKPQRLTRFLLAAACAGARPVEHSKKTTCSCALLCSSSITQLQHSIVSLAVVLSLCFCLFRDMDPVWSGAAAVFL